MQETLVGNTGCIDADDVDAYSEAMSQWDIEVRQISTGKFQSRTEYVEVGGLLLYREQWSRKVITRATTPADSFTFISPRSGLPEIELCNKTLQYGRLGFCHPGSEVQSITPDNNEHVVLEIPRHLLQQIIPEEEMSTLLNFNFHMHTDVVRNSRFMQMIDQTVSKYIAQPESLNDARVCRSIKVQVMDQLSDLLLQHDNGKDDTVPHRRKQILNRALDVIHQLRSPVTLPDLSAIIETTPRSIQRAFNETLHISPLKYLRMSRINAAHKALRKGDKHSASVTEVALDWGFNELGRFSCEYKQLFGESPATTLARDACSPPGDMYSFVRE